MPWLWSKKEAAAELPSTVPTNNPERYDGKPMLRLLEFYVLWSLDHLREDEALQLKAMAPKLTDTFGGDGTWQDAIATTMELPENMSELIREMWTKNRQIADANGVELTPQQFAEMFVDSNLV